MFQRLHTSYHSSESCLNFWLCLVISVGYLYMDMAKKTARRAEKPVIPVSWFFGDEHEIVNGHSPVEKQGEEFG